MIHKGFKCEKCGKVTSTTNEEYYKGKLCPECRETCEPKKESWFSKHPMFTVILLIAITIIVGALLSIWFSSSGL